MDPDVKRHLIEAAQRVADEAKSIAGKWSKTIPAATRVVSDAKGVAVVTDGKAAPAARPNEFGLRHPLFGNREHWYRIPFRPYLLEARDRKMDEIQAAGVRALQDMTARKGY
jgi:hypothetical protein